WRVAARPFSRTPGRSSLAVVLGVALAAVCALYGEPAHSASPPSAYYLGRSVTGMTPAERAQIAAAVAAKRGMIVGRYVASSSMLRHAAGKASWFYTYRLFPRGHAEWANRNRVEFVPMLWGRQVYRGDGSGCDLPLPDGAYRRPSNRPLCADPVGDIVDVLTGVFAELEIRPKFLLGFNEPWL